MNMFGKAFEQGLLAAASAERAKAEIASVIALANEELLRASAGRISIAISSSSALEGFTRTVAMVRNVFDPTTSSARLDHWIAAHNPLATQQHSLKIAKWDQPPEGYPVGVAYEKVNIYCHNREALEETLERLFSSAWAGDKFQQLINLPIAEMQTTAQLPAADTDRTRPETN